MFPEETKHTRKQHKYMKFRGQRDYLNLAVEEDGISGGVIKWVFVLRLGGNQVATHLGSGGSACVAQQSSRSPTFYCAGVKLFYTCDYWEHTRRKKTWNTEIVWVLATSLLVHPSPLQSACLTVQALDKPKIQSWMHARIEGEGGVIHILYCWALFTFYYHICFVPHKVL